MGLDSNWPDNRTLKIFRSPNKNYRWRATYYTLCYLFSSSLQPFTPKKRTKGSLVLYPTGNRTMRHNRRHPNNFRHIWTVVLCALLCFSKLATASHSSGSDIRYRHIGGMTYVIEVSFYRDCGGVSEPSSIVIRCQSASAGFSQNIPAYKSTIPGNGWEVTRPCPTMPSQCNGGSNGGIRKWIYAGQITLPSRQSDWIFSYSVCCRNCAISTISAPCASNSALHVEATLNNLNAGDNHSPAFDQVPVAYVCLGQTYRYNHGIREIEGDSLSIELVTPMTGPGSTVNYLNGYSATQPLATSGAFELDPISGDITFTPQQIQTTVLAIRVKEYRNSICIGSVIRDMQVHVQGCTNSLPSLTGINGSSSYSINACPGEPICFTIGSADDDLNQQLSLATDSGIAGAQYTVSGGTRPVMQFCWTPQPQDAGMNPKRFNVTVYDDACPYNGSRTYSYLVFVGGPRYTIRETPIACKDGSNGALSVLTGPGSYTYAWNNGSTSQDISGLSSGTYTVTVSAGSGTCSSTKSFTLNNPPALMVQAQLSPASCNQSSDGNIALSINGGATPYFFTWSNGANTQNLNAIQSGSYTCIVRDSNGCQTDTSFQLNAGNGPIIQESVNHVQCKGGSNGTISIMSGVNSGQLSYQWNTGSNQSHLQNLQAGNYTVTVSAGNGCTSSESFTITQPDSEIAISPHVIGERCFGSADGSISLAVTGGIAPYQFTWLDGTNTSAHTNLQQGIHEVELTDAIGCVKSKSIHVPGPEAGISAVTHVSNVKCLGASDGFIQLEAIGGTPPYSFHWNTGTKSSAIGLLSAGTYTVSISDANGCITNIQVNVTQPPDSVRATFTSEAFDCARTLPGSIITSASGGTPPYRYSWSTGDSTDNIAAGPGIYTIEIVDAQGCRFTSTAQISFNRNLEIEAEGDESLCPGKTITLHCAVPDSSSIQWYFNGTPLQGATQKSFTTAAAGTYNASALTTCGELKSAPLRIVSEGPTDIAVCNTQIICEGESTELWANGGIRYHWLPEEGLDDPNAQRPQASPDSTTTYTVTVTDESGCEATAEITVTVLCDTLDLPTGFSPNGDGINDTFIIPWITEYPENALFVYNRWGNLVYKARAYKNDWDGRGNQNAAFGEGDQLPEGTYFYLIDLKNGKKPVQGYLLLKR